MFNWIKKTKEEYLNDINDDTVVNTELDFIQDSLKYMMIDFIGEIKNVESGLEEADKNELYSQANMLVNNIAFKKISNHLINQQGNFAIRNAEDYAKVCFCRAVINGIELIREEAERLNAIYLEKNKPIENFDNRKVI